MAQLIEHRVVMWEVVSSTHSWLFGGCQRRLSHALGQSRVRCAHRNLALGLQVKITKRQYTTNNKLQRTIAFASWPILTMVSFLEYLVFSEPFLAQNNCKSFVEWILTFFFILIFDPK